MSKRIRITRYNKDVDGELLWNTYNDPRYVEFFRRIPPSLTRPELLNIESITQSQFFTVLWDEWPCGFVVVSQIENFGLSCQSGVVLFEDFQDKPVDGMKIAFWALYKLCELLFEKTTMRRVSFRFLESRKDIENSFIKAGFKKEGSYEASSFCHGEYQNELEYMCNKEIFKKNKEFVLCLS